MSMFTSPLLLVVVVLLLIFGLFLYFMGVKIFENEKIFIILILVFLGCYFLAALILRHYMKLPAGGADVSSLGSIFSRQGQ